MCDEHKEEVEQNEYVGCEFWNNSECEGPEDELHSCVFAEEIHGDSEPRCSCCSSCQHLCWMET